jgi:hypothetical protein
VTIQEAERAMMESLEVAPQYSFWSGLTITRLIPPGSVVKAGDGLTSIPHWTAVLWNPKSYELIAVADVRNLEFSE